MHAKNISGFDVNYLSDEFNTKEYTVHELSLHIKSAIEYQFGVLKVRGEVSGLKIASSGHSYFNLKDDKAVLNCVCWKTTLNLVKIKVEDGIEVIATGRLTTYSGQSRYQLVVENICIAGLGSLMQIFFQRKEKLMKEGLFDNSRKKKLPAFPMVIGVITSISGAVIRDIAHRVNDRFPSRLLVWPVTVQGNNSANEVASAIQECNNMLTSNHDLAPEVIIIARGGGSVEDLWSFNEEIVVRAIASSVIPIVSAIGHEVDFTLADFAADLRAPTPSAAAEMVVPVLSDIKMRLNNSMNQINYVTFNYLKCSVMSLNNCGNIVQKLKTMIDLNYQKFDELVFRFDTKVEQFGELQKRILQNNVLIDPSKLVQLYALKLENLNNKLYQLVKRLFVNLDNKVYLLDSLLNNMDYSKVLKRGFAIIRLVDGPVVSSLSQLKGNDKIKIQLQDGVRQATIDS
ncbi:exodeoxyribonuclease VII large subunit [Orientia tsutsugamushi]|uniref:exodeoxyribonuclease VII large subunit n=1 Tax=Orientia tsutsugamushi TaxID=784 RepID=UPI0007E2E30B|nr:exodeoxyribonuclease VII large subunit [Orientia tsutsugamushi]